MSSLEPLNRRDLLKAVASYAALPALSIGSTAAAQSLDPARGSTKASLPKAYPEVWTDQDVRYIWNETPETNSPLYLRKIFLLPAKPVRGILNILNDARFGLWINGKVVRSLKQGASWRLCSTYDVTRFLREGENILCIESQGLNTDYHSQPLTPLSGVGALLEVNAGDRFHMLQSDTEWHIAKYVPNDDWLKPQDPNNLWTVRATVVRAANQAPWVNLKNWPKPLPDPASHRLVVLTAKPEKILRFHNEVPGPALQSSRIDFEVDRNKTELWYASSELGVDARLALARKELPGIIVDFGKEVAGRLRIHSASDEPMAVLVSFGETPGEMWNGPHTGIIDLFVPARGSAITLTTGFRYAAIHTIPLSSSKTGIAHLSLAEITCDFVHEPLQYRGSCTSSDRLIEKLWTAGAYTTHLCLQRELWDAPKRDRNVYGGDLHPVTPVLNEVFGNAEPLYRSLDVLSSGIWSAGKPILRHINGISGYSAAWIHVLADTFLHMGDQAELTQRLPFLLELLLYMEGDLDAEFLFLNKLRQWCFVDWAISLDGANIKGAPNSTSAPSEAVLATHFFFLSAFQRAAQLLRTSNHHDAATLSTHYAELANRMRTAARLRWWNATSKSFGTRVQTNAMAIYAGAVEEAEARHIADTILLAPLKPISGALDWSNDTQIVSPYFRFYVLEALALSGRVQEAATAMKSFYGEMLKRGATTLWERFDPRMKAGATIPGFGPDWLAGPYHGGTMYHESSCHGWSSAPTSWITRHIVGLSASAPKCAQIRIAPDLCNLQWIEGSIATPHGLIRVRHSRSATRWQSRLDLPSGVEAIVFLPGLERDHVRVLVNGRDQTLEKDDQGRSFLRIKRVGRTTIEVA